MRKICYVVTVPVTVRAFFIPQLRHLADNGFDVSIVCASDNSLQSELGDDIVYHPIDIPRGVSVFDSLRAIWKLICYFRREQFDLIQYSTPNAALYASVAAKITGCKVRNYHLMGYRYISLSGVGKLLLRRIEKITCSNSTSVECVSKSNLEFGISERIFPQKKATVVWNGSTGGVDFKKFDITKRLKWRTDIRNELGYKEEDFVVGFVGRITRDKGVNELLSAFMELDDGSQLLLVGDVENEKCLNQTLLNRASSNSLIKFHEFVSDIERYYAACDVLILPSYREGFGNVVIEAGAVGTPSIVTDIPGPKDTVVQNQTGIIVPVKDSKELCNAMRTIQCMNYKRMGENAAELVKERYDSTELCKKILQHKLGLINDSIKDC